MHESLVEKGGIVQSRREMASVDAGRVTMLSRNDDEKECASEV